MLSKEEANEESALPLKRAQVGGRTTAVHLALPDSQTSSLSRAPPPQEGNSATAALAADVQRVLTYFMEKPHSRRLLYTAEFRIPDHDDGPGGSAGVPPSPPCVPRKSVREDLENPLPAGLVLHLWVRVRKCLLHSAM